MRFLLTLFLFSGLAFGAGSTSQQGLGSPKGNTITPTSALPIPSRYQPTNPASLVLGSPTALGQYGHIALINGCTTAIAATIQTQPTASTPAITTNDIVVPPAQTANTIPSSIALDSINVSNFVFIRSTGNDISSGCTVYVWVW